MIRCNGLHWTADFTLARALLSAYKAAGKERLVYLCVGDPDDLGDRLGPMVGQELQKYYPFVIGTLEEPVLDANLGEVWRRMEKEWADAFIICVEAGVGAAEHLGHVEVTDRGLRRRPKGAELPPWVGDIGIYAILWPENQTEDSPSLNVNQVHRIADAIIDGQIRFLQNAGKYDPVL